MSWVRSTVSVLAPGAIFKTFSKSLRILGFPRYTKGALFVPSGYTGVAGVFSIACKLHWELLDYILNSLCVTLVASGITKLKLWAISYHCEN